MKSLAFSVAARLAAVSLENFPNCNPLLDLALKYTNVQDFFFERMSKNAVRVVVVADFA